MIAAAQRRPAVWPPVPTLTQLIERYDGFLFDAYGVLVDDQRTLPGARSLLERLDAAGHPWLVVSNAASRPPATLSRAFAALGLEIPPRRLLTSGGLLVDWFLAHGLVGAPCVVLGPVESYDYVEQAGGVVLPLAATHEAAALIITDQNGIALPDDLNLVLSGLLRRLDDPHRPPPALLLCNPDLIYPTGPGQFGITAGAIAALFDAVLTERYLGKARGASGEGRGRTADAPGAACDTVVASSGREPGQWFQRLGKPYRPLFAAGLARLGAQRPLMLGDSLATDIRGALDAGIDALLVGTGLAPAADPATWPVRPTWYVPSLAALMRP